MAHLWLIYLLRLVIYHGYISLLEGIPKERLANLSETIGDLLATVLSERFQSILICEKVRDSKKDNHQGKGLSGRVYLLEVQRSASQDVRKNGAMSGVAYICQHVPSAHPKMVQTYPNTEKFLCTCFGTKVIRRLCE